VSPRMREILDKMESGTWYKPSDLGTSQQMLSKLHAAGIVRKRSLKLKPGSFNLTMESAEFCKRED
jgi:hypothetical protein